MKKGCFISVIVTLTIILAAIFYIFKFHGEDVINFGKEKVMAYAHDKLNKEINQVQESPYADSLKIEIEKYFNDFDEKDIEKEIDKIEEFADNIEVVMRDSKIDSSEYVFIKQLMNKK
ncbi:MAG: hypothetical protein H6613_16705 [Ignavibacteriales bacterium]|nr:hypothetical protein [Ignavibacteriales bacterium]